MKNRIEMNEEMMEQVNGGISFDDILDRLKKAYEKAKETSDCILLG